MSDNQIDSPGGNRTTRYCHQSNASDIGSEQALLQELHRPEIPDGSVAQTASPRTY